MNILRIHFGNGYIKLVFGFFDNTAGYLPLFF